MPINLAGGYAAGGLHDALLEIVKQRMLEQELAQRQQEQEFQRLRSERLDKQHADETTYQHGRDTAGDLVAKEARDRQAKLDAIAIGKEQLAQMQDRPFKELVDPATQGFGPKAVPAVGLPPLPGTNVAGVSPPEVRQGQLRTVDIGGMAVKPRTMEERDTAAAADEQRKLQNEIAKQKALEAAKPKALQHVAGTFQGKPAMGAFDPETASTTPIPGWTPTPPQPQTVVMSTVDENGIPVNQIVPKVAGATYKRGPNATTGNRIDSALVVAQTGNDLITHLSDPAFQAVVGPAMGRASSLRDFIGNPPPEFAELAGQIESYALANMGVHGMRSAEGAKQIAALLDQRHTPASLIATVKGLNAFSEHYLENAGRTVPTGGGGGTDAQSALDAILKANAPGGRGGGAGPNTGTGRGGGR